ncbi:MAG: hypothetical protein KF836_09905 [Fimbriimonadaceae bacterium]|nr:hypothetical protein [Fimbriimonadaceae bacterium]
MGKNLAFLAVGVAIGFVLSKVIDRVIEQSQDAHALADNIDQKLELLEGQLA